MNAYATTAGARYTSPLASSAQTMRAILLASATRTSIGGLRATMRAIHDPAGAPLRATQSKTAVRADDQQAAQRSLAHLRGGAQLLLAAGRMLQRREPDPGGKVPAALERLSRWRKGRQSHCGDRADSRNGHQPPRRLILLALSATSRSRRAICSSKPMERLDQHLQDRSGELRDRLGPILDSLHEVRNVSRPFGPDEPELRQMPAQGIDDLGPLPHQEIARPEHDSCGLGLLALGRHEAHGRALGRLADGLRIRRIVLLPLDEGLT